MNTETICPCDKFVHPRAISNPPGRHSISYRVGDFTTFRHALLLSRPGEIELVNWRPSATQDLAVQMVEWWAYLADILTFYNERIATQDYLRTADLPESVNRLIRVLGYRPRPGIGATGTLAALLSRPVMLTLPRGFQVQSKPGPGQQPQIFELDADTTIHPPDAVPADPAPDPALLQTDASTGLSSVLLAGTITSMKQGDALLLLETGWNGADAHWSLVSVHAVRPETDPHGKTNTRVVFDATPNLPAGARADGYRLLRSNRSARAWPYQIGSGFSAIDVTNSEVNLDSITREIKVGDPILFDIGPGASFLPQVVSVTSYTESVWYANPDPPARDPTKPPANPPNPPIPITHSVVDFTPQLTGDWESHKQQALVRFGWQDVGPLITTPATTLSATATTLVATPPAMFPSGSNVPVMLEDATGIGESAFGSVVGSPSMMHVSGLPDPPVSLTPPLNVLYSLMQVSRGKTVTGEILGSGDATQAGQEFVLKNAPLTYLLSTASTSGQNYKSTLQVRVDGAAWQEVPSFYGQPPDAHVFVTREDEHNQTHIIFGDGINGARLTTGINNVVASYRFGSGATSPPAGSLTVILHPQPNLKTIRNPVAVGGGADPDPPDQIRRYAPQSVLTFGRAISGDDYETIAAQAPGVARARSYWMWDAEQQRALVTLYVGDDASAMHAATTALALADDPNRPVIVKLATPVPVHLSLTLLIAPQYDTSAVVAGVTAALLDPQHGLLGASIRIGQTLYDSQIAEACLSVPGALAVHALQFSMPGLSPLRVQRMMPTSALHTLSFRFGFGVNAPRRHAPGEGSFFHLTTDNLVITPEVADHAG
jgi:hypothetical protein